MLASRRMSRAGLEVCVSLISLVTAAVPVAAQDAPAIDPASTREQQLRDQLRNILHELDEVQLQKERATPEAERPAIIKEEAEPKMTLILKELISSL